MSIELKVPAAGESVSEVRIGEWLKQEGDLVQKDETIVELDSDKAALEVPAPVTGKLTKIVLQVGDEAAPGDVLAYIDEETPAETAAAEEPASPAAGNKSQAQMAAEHEDLAPLNADRAKAPPPTDGKAASPRSKPQSTQSTPPTTSRLTEKQQDQPSPSKGKVSKPSPPEPPETDDEEIDRQQTEEQEPEIDQPADRDEEIVPMTMLRRRIAENLVEATQQMALLTTVNEVDMSAVQKLRKRYQEQFQEAYGIRLGYMSLFVKAAIEGLKQFPKLNAELRGTDIVYRNHYDIGVAIGSKRGLVVPVIQHAEHLSFAEIEKTIADFADRAERNKLRPEELAGGTFTITNGGVYGSLLSTPIVNPPQSAILGMHAIVERPVARNGQVVIRPMMYLALTYDHRLIDGREAVLFLRSLKERIEDPARILLEV